MFGIRHIRPSRATVVRACVCLFLCALCASSGDAAEQCGEKWEINESCFARDCVITPASIAAAILIAPVLLGLIGFTALGIGPATIAAGMMGWYGGAVPAMSIVAILQSLGAYGFAYGAMVKILSAIGGANCAKCLARGC